MKNTFTSTMARAVCRGLPWLALFAISASAAYGMTVGVAGTESVAPIDGPVSSGPCDAMSAQMLRNAGANGWIPDRSAGYCERN
jgi:hypothetical protein